MVSALSREERTRIAQDLLDEIEKIAREVAIYDLLVVDSRPRDANLIVALRNEITYRSRSIR